MPAKEEREAKEEIQIKKLQEAIIPNVISEVKETRQLVGKVKTEGDDQ